MDPISLKNNEGILNQFTNFKPGTLQMNRQKLICSSWPEMSQSTANLTKRHCHCTNNVRENAETNWLDQESKYLWRSDPETHLVIERVGGAIPIQLVVLMGFLLVRLEPFSVPPPKTWEMMRMSRMTPPKTVSATGSNSCGSQIAGLSCLKLLAQAPRLGILRSKTSLGNPAFPCR